MNLKIPEHYIMKTKLQNLTEWIILKIWNTL